MLKELRSRFRNFLMYWANWALAKSNSKHAQKTLFSLAFVESIFFPIPPDVLLISMSAGNNKKALYYAFLTTAGSVLGAVIGYAIGYFFYDSIGKALITLLNIESQFSTVGTLFSKYDFLVIFAAAFTPIPYKVFTLSAGFWHINMASFVFASIVGRGMRFYIQGFLFYFYGAKITSFVKKYIELVSMAIFLVVAAVVLLLGQNA